MQSDLQDPLASVLTLTNAGTIEYPMTETLQLIEGLDPIQAKNRWQTLMQNAVKQEMESDSPKYTTTGAATAHFCFNAKKKEGVQRTYKFIKRDELLEVMQLFKPTAVREQVLKYRQQVPIPSEPMAPATHVSHADSTAQMDTEELQHLSDATATSLQQHERLQMAREQDAANAVPVPVVRSPYFAQPAPPRSVAPSVAQLSHRSAGTPFLRLPRPDGSGYEEIEVSVASKLVLVPC